MAVEVDDQDYTFVPAKSLEEVLAEIDAYTREAERDPPHPKEHPDFFHNPLHDLESLWWIAVYVVLQNEATQNNTVGPTQSDESWDSNAQLVYATKLFSDSLARSNIIEGRGRFLDNMRQVLHHSMKPLALYLEALRRELVHTYRDAEKNVNTIDHHCAAGLCTQFHKIFTQIAKADNLQNISLRQLTYRPPVDALIQHSLSPLTDDGDVIMSDDSSSHEPVVQNRPVDEPHAATSIRCRRYNLRPRKNLPRRGLR